MVKGYEFAKDRYVTFTEEEIKAMGRGRPAQTIEITEFVCRCKKVDPIYFDIAVLPGPGQGGERALRACWPRP